MKPHLFRAFTVRCAGALAVSLLCLACEDASPPIVPTPIPTPASSPEQSFSLNGTVVDTASRVLVGARIEVLDGARAGTVTITDEHGHFALPGIFTGTVRLMASQDGFLSRTQTYAIPTNRPVSGFVEGWVTFSLELPGPSAQILGDFTLALIADASCTGLPDTVRTRRYTATIGNGSRAHSFEARLSGAQFFAWAVPCPLRGSDCLKNRFSLGTAGDSVGGYMTIIEQVTDTSYLIADGAIGGSISPTGVTAALSGDLDFCPIQPVQIDQGVWVCWPSSGVSCHSENHQIELIRR
jgi:hypothetical protein